VNVTAIVFQPGGASQELGTVATDGNGRAAFTGLTISGAPGQYELDFVASGFQEHVVPLDLSAAP
jgi:hypothetical protein